MRIERKSMSGNVEIVELTRTIRRQMEPGLAAAVSEAKQAADEILDEDIPANRQFAVVQLYFSSGRDCLKQVFRMPSRQMA